MGQAERLVWRRKPDDSELGGGGGATRCFRRPDGPTLMVESGGRNQMIQNDVLGGASRCYSIGGFQMFQEIRWPGPDSSEWVERSK